MLRFSHCVVPVGKVPSRGMALTGRSSPSPAIMRAGELLHEIGRAAGTGGRKSKVVVASAGLSLHAEWQSAASTAAKFFCTTASPRLP